MNIRAGLVIIALGLFALAAQMHFDEGNEAPQPYAAQISATKQWLHDHARDPASVRYHSVGAGESDSMRVVTADFTGENGFGGKTRSRWTFGYDKTSNRLLAIYDDSTGNIVAQFR